MSQSCTDGVSFLSVQCKFKINIYLPVQLCAKDSSEVADADLHGIRRRSLSLTADVIGRPRQDNGGGGVDAPSGKDRA